MALRSRPVLMALVLAIGLVVMFVALYFIFVIPEPLRISKKFKTWATALDEGQCSHVSAEIYKKGGTVADATVASLLCLGVVLPESLGIGGGFLALYFKKSTGEVHFLDARETAPASASRDMFTSEKVDSTRGPLTVAVPGELKGYAALLDFVGSNLTQRDLFQPAIDVARSGFYAGNHLAEAMSSRIKYILASEEMREIYINPKTLLTWEEGELMKNPKLADTMEKLAKSENFVQEFYEGSVGESIVKQLRDMGGILTMEDLKNFQPKWRPASRSQMQNKYDVYSASLPGSGSLLSLMVNVLDAFREKKIPEKVLTYHHLTEIMKFAYAKRSLLGDIDFENVTALADQLQSKEFAAEIRQKINDKQTLDIKEYGGAINEPRDHGTSHASFVGPNGDVIAITSTINFYFGAAVQIDGVILNNEMNDFSTPNQTNGFGLIASETNFIKPGKRPMSSMVPTIIVENGEARMVLGGAGGSQITSAALQVILRYFYQGHPVESAIRACRIHHQYMPNKIVYEPDNLCSESQMQELKNFGHTIERRNPKTRGSVIVAIVRDGDDLEACYDPRKGGAVSGE